MTNDFNMNTSFQQQQQQHQHQQSPSLPNTSIRAMSSFNHVVSQEAATAAFQKTIALNNAGVQHMDQGQHLKAAKLLTTAFYAFKKAYYKQKHHLPSLLVQQQLNPETAESVSSLQNLLLNVDELFRRNHKKRHCEDDEQNNDQFLEQDKVSVYGHPIHLPKDYPITQESCGFLSTTITFNLALANHMVGIELWEQQQQRHHHNVSSHQQVASDNNKIGSVPPAAPLKSSTVMKHLQTAGRLYEYTIRLERARSQQQQQQQQQRMAMIMATSGMASQSSLTSRGGFPPLFVSPFVLMAILNNLGHLHTVLLNQVQAEKCFRQLQSTLMYMLQFQKTNNNNGGNRTTGASNNNHHRHRHHHSHDSRRDNDSHTTCSYRDLIQVFMENASLGLKTTRLTAAAA